jgi:hypothetical protein
MAEGCGATFAKIMLIIFNIIFLCSGLVLIALGIWLLVLLAQSDGLTDVFARAYGSGFYRNAAILLIAMGCLILFVTILGLVAAIRESKILLTIYLVFICIVFGGEIAAGVVAIVYKDKLLEELKNTLRGSQDFTTSAPYYENSTTTCASTVKGRIWDLIQIQFHCCGLATNETGYGMVPDVAMNKCNSTKFAYPALKAPLTCCERNVSGFDYRDQKTNEFMCGSTVNADNRLGCIQTIQNWIIKYAPVLIGIGIGFGMLEMFGVIFVVCLCQNSDKGFKRF